MAISISGYYQLGMMDDRVRHEQKWVEHTYQVQAGLDALTGHLVDTETGQRGFLLTGDDRYLEPFYSGKELARLNLSTLKTLTQDNAEQQRLLHELAVLMGAKFAELDQTVRLYQQGERDKSLNIVRSDVGKEAMDKIRTLVEQARFIESKLLVGRKTLHENAMSLQMNSSFLWVVLSIIGAMLLILLLYKRILNPINLLMQMTDDFKDGKLDHKIDFTVKDELGHLGRTFVDMAEEIEKQGADMRERENLNRVYGSAVAMLSAANDWEMAFSEVLAIISMHLPVPTGAIYLLNASKSELLLAVSHGIDDKMTGKFSVSTSLLGEAVSSGEIVEIQHGKDDGVFIDTGLISIHPKQILMVPMAYRQEHVGCLVLAATGLLTEVQQVFLQKVAADMAIAMKDIERYQQLQELNNELESSREQLQQERDDAVEDSITDGLTGVYNRGYLDLSMKQLFQNARRNKQSLSLMLLDIDYFKQVNDTYGHPCGDEVLKRVAKRMENTLRETDFVARYGGEEFACILHHADVNIARGLADKVRKAIAAEVFAEMDGKSVTISIGVSELME
ncbi:MAG: diguanylate cyclase, partial [Mariprofundaceae bacterium]